MNTKLQVILFFCFLSGLSLIQSQDALKFKVGILRNSGDKLLLIKSSDRVKAGDRLRVLVQSINEVYVYALLVEDKEVTLLNRDKMKAKLKKNKSLNLPSESEFYQVDGTSSKMKIFIIGSEAPIDQFQSLFASSDVISVDKWVPVENKLLIETKSQLNQTSEKPFNIAGNVRGVNDDFLKNLPVLQGKGKILRKYEIEVKK